MRAGAFPGTISARKLLFDIGPTCSSPELAAKRSANTCTSEATEGRKNAGTSGALREGSAAGAYADGLARVTACVAGPSAAAGGNTRARGTRQHERARCWTPGDAQPSMKNRLQQYLVSLPSADNQTGPYHAVILKKYSTDTESNQRSCHTYSRGYKRNRPLRHSVLSDCAT